MSKTKYKKGDRVVCIKCYRDFNFCIAKGMRGTVSESTSHKIGVIWDNYSEGHTLVPGSTKNNGLFVNKENIKKLNKPVKRKRNVLMQYIQALFIKMKNHYKCCHSRMDGIVKRCDKRAKKTENYISCVNEKVLKLGELCTNRFAYFRNTEVDLRELRKDIAALKKDVHEINPFVDTAKERYEQLKKDEDGDYEIYDVNKMFGEEPVNEQGYTMEEIKKHYKDGRYVMFCDVAYGRNNAPLDFTANIKNYKIVVFPTKGGQNGC